MPLTFSNHFLLHFLKPVSDQMLTNYGESEGVYLNFCKMEKHIIHGMAPSKSGQDSRLWKNK